METYKLVLENACGEQFALAEKVTLSQANIIVDGLDARYGLLDVEELEEGDVMLQYEGGNVLACHENGTVLLYTGATDDDGICWEQL